MDLKEINSIDELIKIAETENTRYPKIPMHPLRTNPQRSIDAPIGKEELKGTEPSYAHKDDDDDIKPSDEPAEQSMKGVKQWI
jgi:hypothetical protein